MNHNGIVRSIHQRRKTSPNFHHLKEQKPLCQHPPPPNFLIKVKIENPRPPWLKLQQYTAKHSHPGNRNSKVLLAYTTPHGYQDVELNFFMAE